MKTYSSKLRNSACFVIFLVFLFYGLAGAADPNTPARTAADPGKTGVAVIVNGVDITESQIEAAIKPQLERMAAQTAKIPPAFVEQLKRQIRQSALEKMIVELLLDEEVKKAQIVITEEDVIAHLKESGLRQQPPLSLEETRALIEAQGQSFDEVKKQLQTSKAMRYQKIMEAQWAGKIDVTGDDAKKYYSENKKRFETPEQVRASHILIKPDTTDPNTDPNEAKAKAENLLKQIKGGADFATLARANSGCPSGAKGGDLGLFGRGQMVPAFEKAAFELKVGQVSDIVETRFGYHIIKVTDHKDPNIITFEQAKDDIINRLTQKKHRELAMQYIESLKAEANIVYPLGKEPKGDPAMPIPK